MAINNSQICYETSTITSINFGTFTPIVGQFYYASDGLINSEQCVEILNTTNELSAVMTAETLYTSCYDCMAANRGYAVFSSCFGGLPPLQFTVLISDLGFLPSIDDVFYTSLTQLGGDSAGIYEGCFEIAKVAILPEIEYNKVIQDNDYAIVNSYTAKTDCQTCIDNSPLVYIVSRCYDETVFYVALPNNTFSNHVISFQVGTEEFCGLVKISAETATTGVFISDFGLRDGSKNYCDTCLSIVSQKTLLQNCTNELDQIVVWSSVLYGAGDISNLSALGGCYQVVGLTESAVTTNDYFNFDPQPGCDPCLECNGYTYEFIGCDGETIGDFSSNQTLSLEDVVYNPSTNSCCKITTISNGITSANFFSSVRYFGNGDSGCTECSLVQPNAIQYQGKICGSNVYVYLNSFNTLVIGEIVKIKYGSLNFVCVEIITPGTSEITNVFDVVTILSSNDTLVYAICDDCTNENLGITVVRCSTGVEKFVSMTHSDWLNATGYYLPNQGSVYFPYSTFKLNDNLCYQSISYCPIPLSSTTESVTVTDSYILCSFCSEGEPPRSANTESTICVICCPCSSGETITSVSPPHPVWTDSQGTAVTQLNAITLGGMNGLNN